MMDRKNTINVFQIFSISPVNQILKNNGLKKCHVKLYTGIPAVDRYADIYRQRPIYIGRGRYIGFANKKVNIGSLTDIRMYYLFS